MQMLPTVRKKREGDIV